VGAPADHGLNDEEERDYMTVVGKTLPKAGVLWLGLVFGQGLGGWLFLRTTPVFAVDGPLDATQAMLTVCAADALILTLLAYTMQARGWALGFVLSALLFGVQTGQALIEAVVFRADVRMSFATLASVAEAAVLRDALAGAAIALLWRGAGTTSRSLRGLAWKVPVVALLYVGCYFSAGRLIAWQSPAVRAFYAHVQHLDTTLLVAVQFGRGLVWCGLAWLLARGLAGSPRRAAMLTGLAFSGFMTFQALYPNPVMPWPVRAVHMMEVGVSNFIFGALAALILRASAEMMARVLTVPPSTPPRLRRQSHIGWHVTG
jgi:hypothetical protein